AVFLAGFAALTVASPASQVIDFASVNAAPSPSLTGPPPFATINEVSINIASVAAEGSAAVTGVASASATASQAVNAKRVWGWDVTSVSSTTSSTTSCPTTPEPGTYCGFINPEDACAIQPDGYGPHVEPDTPDAFLAYPEFHEEARAAKAPAGYVETFVDLNASVSANTYLGLQTLQSYDVSLCAQYCDSKDLCTGFNIFFERDPSLNPSANCTQPASITNYKCTLWGSGVYTASATNYGDYRGEFHVVITGSDGFEKTNTTTPPSQPGWQPPQQCGSDGGSVHNHPNNCMGTSFFPGPYNPAVCANYAQAQNSQNKQSPWWSQWVNAWTGYNSHQCDFFNSYMLKKNGHPLGTYCALFSQSYSGGEAIYTPGWQGSDYWSIESSWGWEI
ncbi:uncharacterized protein LY89DRAFT_546028, partial [Mollisia scopiformis]